MLRIECYPQMDGVMLHVSGYDPDQLPHDRQANAVSVWRNISANTIDELGLPRALTTEFADICDTHISLLEYGRL